MENSIVFADKRSIIGLWANFVLTDVGIDNSVIVFHPDGNGFIHYTQIDFEIIETFKWCMNKANLSVQGQYTFNGDNGVFKRVAQSTVQVTSNQVLLMKRMSRHGVEVDAIQFTKPLIWTCDENDVFGLWYKHTDRKYQLYLEGICDCIRGVS